jgi:sulfate permease, SulP family
VRFPMTQLSTQDPTWPEPPGPISEPDVAEPAAHGARERFFRLVPALGSLRRYSWKDLGRDGVAGLTVATVALPQAMAYAAIAGLPAQYGLYTAIVVTAVGALFDSSRQLINGPTNAISIALLSALAVVPESEKLPAAVVLAMLVGLVQTGITLLRLGDLTRYISQAVIVGFTLGAGVLLVLDQLKNFLGLQAEGESTAPFLKRFWLTLTQGGGVHGPTVAIGAGSILLILALRWLNHQLRARHIRVFIPELLLAVAAMAALVWAYGLHEQGVAVIGPIPALLPSFSPPPISWELTLKLMESALAIAMLGLLEAIAMAKAIAAQTGQKLDINQQCLSEGLANLSGSFFHCFPGSGSLTRSAINQQAGAVSQWSGVVSAAAVAAITLLFAPLAQYIPRSALAGLLILTGWRMVDRHQLYYHLRATRFDAGIVLATALSAIFISVEFCILIGVLLSFVLYIPRAAGAYLSEFYLTAEGFVRERVPGDPPCDRILLYNLEGELFFGSANMLEGQLARLEGKVREQTRVVVLRVKRVRNPDAVCLRVLDNFVKHLQERRVTVLVCGVRPALADALARIGLQDRLGAHHVFPEAASVMSSTLSALRYAYAMLDGATCSTCPRHVEGLIAHARQTTDGSLAPAAKAHLTSDDIVSRS